MILEMVFQVISTSARCPPLIDCCGIIETITNRMLDGPNLSLVSLSLLYLYAFEDADNNEEQFLVSLKVNQANKPIVGLFKYYHFVLLKLNDPDSAHNFIKQVLLSTSEVCFENVHYNSFNEMSLVINSVQKSNETDTEDYTELIRLLGEGKTRTKQFGDFISTVKKAYYTIAMRETSSCVEKLKVLNGFIQEIVEVDSNDIEMMDSLIVKIGDREEYETYIRLFYELLERCRQDNSPGFLSFMFLMMVFEEISEYSRRQKDYHISIKLFLEMQFIRFPSEMVEFRKYKSLLIKYFPFYLLKNLSFIKGGDPVRQIIDKHLEFKELFQEISKPLKVEGIEINLINPVDVVDSKKMKQLLSGDQQAAENTLDMLRLEIEIWENFMNQVAHFDNQEKKNYQCMLRSSMFHSFLNIFPKLKQKRQKISLGNFLHNLCIHNDDLVKMILHQAFDDELIVDAVEYIEWFHVTLIYCDFLLSNTFEPTRLHFYYKLLTETIKKYPAQIAKDVARNLIVNHFAYVELNPEENVVVLQSIRTILDTFPSLDTERLFLIQHYRGIQKDLCVFDISYIYIDRLTRELEKMTSIK